MDKHHSNIVLDSYLIDKRVYSENNYVAGYALIQKNKCEVVNFISPTLRLLNFMEGSAEWIVNGKIHIFEPGNIVVFNNICMRNIHKIFGEYIVYEMYDFPLSILYSTDLWKIFYDEHHIVANKYDEKFSSISLLLDFLHKEMLSDDNIPHHVESIKNLINLIAIEILRNLEKDLEKVPVSVFRISESIHYISSHLTEKLDLQSLAKRSGYTPEHYSRLFKSCLGLTPKQYIINARLDNAIHLIQNDHYSVLEAAFASGFHSSAAFYKTFKLYRGTSPHLFISGSSDV